MSKTDPKPLDPNAKPFDYHPCRKEFYSVLPSYQPPPPPLHQPLLPLPTVYPLYNYNNPQYPSYSTWPQIPSLWPPITVSPPYVASIPQPTLNTPCYNYTSSTTFGVCAETASNNMERKSRDLELSELSLEVGEVKRSCSVTMRRWVAKRFKGWKERSFLGRSFGKNMVFGWRPKGKSSSNTLDKDDEDFGKKLGDRTSLMIKNIPNKFRDMLITLLDNHCKDENQKAKSRSDLDDSDPSLSKYDFVYLPMDFRTGCNKGYAFVNFTCSVAALRLYESLHDYKWEVFDTKKVCAISIARIQGKNSLVGHFRLSRFPCDTDDFLPVVLSPPRNGATSCPLPSIVGRRAAAAEASA